MTMTPTRRRQRRPTHPGEFIREDFLPDYDLSVADLAEAIKVSRQTVNELINEKRAVSAAMALRLSRFFGNSPEFWLNAQRELDLWEAERLHKAELNQIRPAPAA
jgi:addiction module HigA family antidote